MRHVAVAAILTIFVAQAASAEPVAPAPAEAGQTAAVLQKVSQEKASISKRHKVARAQHRAQEERFWAEVRRRREELARLLAHPPAARPTDLGLIAPIEAGYRAPAAPLVEAAAARAGACGSTPCSRFVLLGVGY